MRKCGFRSCSTSIAIWAVSEIAEVLDVPEGTVKSEDFSRPGQRLRKSIWTGLKNNHDMLLGRFR